MRDNRRAPVQPCVECGWPALAGTRRCPYCRVRMGRDRRAGLLRLVPTREWLSGPLGWPILLWVAMMTPLVVLVLAVFGPAAASLTGLLLLSPFAFAWLLNRRSAARIRGLDAAARHQPRSPGRGPANRPTPGPRS